MRRPPMTMEAARSIAFGGLGMLAEDPDRIARFFNLSGLDPAQIRELAGTPAFQAAVLAHIRADETLLLTFAANQAIDPEDVGRAEHLLSGEPRNS